MAAMRETLVKQAVNFLREPGLKSISWEMIKPFLTTKGLTDEEIMEAQRRFWWGAAKVGEASCQHYTQDSTSVFNGPILSMPPATSAVSCTEIIGGPASAVEFFKRRLVELEHEHACYCMALKALSASAVTPSSLQSPSMVANRKGCPSGSDMSSTTTAHCDRDDDTTAMIPQLRKPWESSYGVTNDVTILEDVAVENRRLIDDDSDLVDSRQHTKAEADKA
eukprot:TRINITY_DN61684_c0_g1_i1.p1 TRINITY_DN61684_c0_g1~~TRINITY_DN61684_c0_g1_i1.p1  ORF type:complete len:222 (+),score=35.71 TRINITY_DN61684_c0_g1_i1:135-800(+)